MANTELRCRIMGDYWNTRNTPPSKTCAIMLIFHCRNKFINELSQLASFSKCKSKVKTCKYRDKVQVTQIQDEFDLWNFSKNFGNHANVLQVVYRHFRTRIREDSTIFTIIALFRIFRQLKRVSGCFLGRLISIESFKIG